MKHYFLASAALVMALSVPFLSSCGDDDDNTPSALAVGQYSPEEANAYMKQHFVTATNQAVVVGNLAYAQEVVHHFRDVYEKYEPVDANVTAENVLSDLYDVVLNGKVNFVEFLEKYEKVKGEYTANDNTKKWEKTADTNNFTLNFKEQNGLDMKAVMSIIDTLLASNGRRVGVSFSMTGGKGINVSVGGMFFIGSQASSGTLRTEFGKMKLVRSFLATQKHLNVTSVLLADGKIVLNSEMRFAGDNCLAAATGGLSASKLNQLESTVAIGDHFISHITCSDIQALREVRKATYSSKKDSIQALADARNKYIKQQVFDNNYKLLFTNEYGVRSVQAASGTNYPIVDNGSAYFIAPVYKYADGTPFDIVSVLGVDKEKMTETITSIIEMIEEAKSHYKRSRAVIV